MMAVKIRTQKDYLLTEVNVDLPCNLSEVDFLMRSIKGTGRIVAQYSQGALLGVNVEQRSKMSERESDRTRELIGVDTKEINGE
jgi:hypothetical protein